MTPNCSRLEMMVVAASRLLRNHERVLVGTGIPLVAAILAKKTHARDMVMVMEAVAEMTRRGVKPPIFRSANLPGGDEFNAKLVKRFKPRVKDL